MRPQLLIAFVCGSLLNVGQREKILRKGCRLKSLCEDCSLAAKVLVVALAASLLTPAVRAAVHYQPLKSFGFPDLIGQQPRAPLIQASNGLLYGTTALGGSNAAGTVFCLRQDGGGYTVLHHFNSTGGDGRGPAAGLAQGSDGVLYGTTAYGDNNVGTVFKLNQDGGGYSLLHSFSTNGNEAQNPSSGLVEGSDGALYGTTANGGAAGAGTVFRLNKDGTGFGVLYSFGTNCCGINIQPSGLVEGSDGALYGTTTYGGAGNCQFGCGTVFKLNNDGSGYTLLHSFLGGYGHHDGEQPLAGVIEGKDGALYGTTSWGTGSGGPSDGGYGTLFKLNKDGSDYRILLDFDFNNRGANPSGALMEGSDGRIYGTTRGGLNNSGTAFALGKDGAGYNLLYRFGRFPDDGGNPQTGLVQGGDGALYGTTFGGGHRGYGAIFRLATDGSAYSILRSLGNTVTDGNLPNAALMEGSDGALYGTTLSGGENGEGMAFKLAKDGSGYSILHDFSFNRGDGYRPRAGLVEGSDGALYGTTEGGGSLGFFGGAVFTMNKDGSGYTILHSFVYNGPDGYNPQAGLVEGSNGVFYGTAQYGGSGGFYGGTVFKVNRDGSAFSLLHNFSAFNVDGFFPVAGLIKGSDGALYGTTKNGGSNGFYGGTVYRMSSDGTAYSVLHHFGANNGDGYAPVAGLIQGSDGVLYGTTQGGGAHSAGTIFKLNKDGSSYSLLRSFGGGSGEVWYPSTSLVEGSDGALYGATPTSLHPPNGAVFKLDKDGSSYSVLHQFAYTGSQAFGSNLFAPFASLSKGSDGAFYGTTPNGGDYGSGTLFKLWPPQTPDLLGVTITGGSARVGFAGVSGYHYQVLRSTDLSHWTALGPITMPAAGTYTNVDNAPPNPAAFYRAVWAP